MRAKVTEADVRLAERIGMPEMAAPLRRRLPLWVRVRLWSARLGRTR
jgi:hypothetical protein